MELNTGVQINISTLLRRQHSTKSARPWLSSAMEAAVVIPFLTASTTWKQKTQQQKNVKTLLATELNGHVRAQPLSACLWKLCSTSHGFFLYIPVGWWGVPALHIALLNYAKGSFPTVPHCLKLSQLTSKQKFMKPSTRHKNTYTSCTNRAAATTAM